MKTKKILSVLAVLALIVSVMSFSGCAQATSGSTSPFAGTWKTATILESWSSYTFTDTGFTNKSSVFGYAMPDTTGTYSYDATKSTITLTSGSTSVTYTYKINGSTLTLTDSDVTSTYTKQ